MIRLTARITALLAPVVLLPLVAAPALAHVTATPAVADSEYFRTAFRVSHGCDGEPTTTVRIQIPEGVANPRPEVVTGWETELVHEELDEPIEDGHGEQVTERVAEVVWTGGSLPEENFQEFGLSFRITEEAGDVLWFPTIQECAEGEHRWIEIPDSVAEWGDLEEPAPYVEVDLEGGEEDAVAEEGAAESAEQAAATGIGIDPVGVAALTAGLLGLVAGVAGFLRGARRR